MNVTEIELQAIQEVDQEEFRARVEARKVILRARRRMPWWHNVLPFKVTWTGWSQDNV